MMTASEFLAVAFAAAVTVVLGPNGVAVYLSGKQKSSGEYPMKAIAPDVMGYSCASFLSCGFAGWYLGKGFVQSALTPFEVVMRFFFLLLKAGFK